MILRKSFYIRWSAGRSPRVHEVNPGRDSSHILHTAFSACQVFGAVAGERFKLI